MNALVTTRPGSRARGATLRLGGPMITLAVTMLLALVVQVVVGTEQDAFNWSAASAIVTLLVLGYCLRPGLFQRFPLSTFAIVGFNAVTLAIPLVVQSATGRSFLFNLRDPSDTFVWIYLTSAVLVGTHFLYASVPALHRLGEFLASRIFAPIGLFRLPSTAETWALGLIGFVATVAAWATNQGSVEYGDLSGKALQGFFLFVAFPLFIPFRGLFAGRDIKTAPFTLALIIPYFGAVVLLGMAANQRILFSFVAIGLALGTLLLSLMGRLRLSGRMKLGMVALLAAALPLFGTFEDLATAMTMVRGAKGSLSGAEYLQRTVEQMGDRASIARFREYEEQDSSNSIAYNEDYLSSQLLNRLVFTKYTDLTMDDSSRFGTQEREVIRSDVWTRLAAILPTPVATFFGLQLDKKLLEYSGGDVYENQAHGTEVGSALTGSSITYARDAFGSAWLFVMVPIFLLLFNSYDSLFLATGQRRVLAPVAFIMLYGLFGHGCVDDNVVSLINAATRGILQQAAVYVVTMVVIRSLLSFQSARS